VALAYVPSLLATDGRIFEIGMRGGNRKAQVCSYPFVRHTSAG
jgi:glycine cleavage system aminomethyltransferase T